MKKITTVLDLGCTHLVMGYFISKLITTDFCLYAERGEAVCSFCCELCKYKKVCKEPQI